VLKIVCDSKFIPVSVREASFPTTLGTETRVKSLAEFGFYADGPRNVVRCFYCNALVIKAFDERVPVVELHPKRIHCDWNKLVKEHQKSVLPHLECKICVEKFDYLYTILPCGHSEICFRCVFQTLPLCPLRCEAYAIVKTIQL